MIMDFMSHFVGREWLRNDTFPPRLEGLRPFQPYNRILSAQLSAPSTFTNL